MSQVVKILRVFPYSNMVVVEWPRGNTTEFVAGWSPWIVVDPTPATKEERRPTFDDEFEVVSMYWGQGHYFSSRESAIRYALEEEAEAFNGHHDWLKDQELNKKGDF